MSDLVKRLREPTFYSHPTTEDGIAAADRIDELALKLLAAEGQAADNLERTERAEAMLKEAVEAGKE